MSIVDKTQNINLENQTSDKLKKGRKYAGLGATLSLALMMALSSCGEKSDYEEASDDFIDAQEELQDATEEKKEADKRYEEAVEEYNKAKQEVKEESRKL